MDRRTKVDGQETCTDIPTQTDRLTGLCTDRQLQMLSDRQTNEWTIQKTERQTNE